jgi:hypothetical protein
MDLLRYFLHSFLFVHSFLFQTTSFVVIRFVNAHISLTHPCSTRVRMSIVSLCLGKCVTCILLWCLSHMVVFVQCMRQSNTREIQSTCDWLTYVHPCIPRRTYFQLIPCLHFTSSCHFSCSLHSLWFVLKWRILIGEGGSVSTQIDLHPITSAACMCDYCNVLYCMIVCLIVFLSAPSFITANVISFLLILSFHSLLAQARVMR